MKTSFYVIALALSQILIAQASHASLENLSRDCGPAFFQEVRELIQNCTENNHVKPTCHQVKVVNNDVFFILKGQNYVAHVTVSEDADGDDLNDVAIVGRLHGGKSCKAQLHNVLAFNEPLRALGGN